MGQSTWEPLTESSTMPWLEYKTFFLGLRWVLDWYELFDMQPGRGWRQYEIIYCIGTHAVVWVCQKKKKFPGIKRYNRNSDQCGWPLYCSAYITAGITLTPVMSTYVFKVCSVFKTFNCKYYPLSSFILWISWTSCWPVLLITYYLYIWSLAGPDPFSVLSSNP